MTCLHVHRMNHSMCARAACAPQRTHVMSTCVLATASLCATRACRKGNWRKTSPSYLDSTLVLGGSASVWYSSLSHIARTAPLPPVLFSLSFSPRLVGKVSERHAAVALHREAPSSSSTRGRRPAGHAASPTDGKAAARRVVGEQRKHRRCDAASWRQTSQPAWGMSCVT